MNDRRTELASALAGAPMTDNQKLVAALRNDMNDAAYSVCEALKYVIRLEQEGIFTSDLLKHDLTTALTALDRPDLIPDSLVDNQGDDS